jgi:hypothetical protein
MPLRPEPEGAGQWWGWLLAMREWHRGFPRETHGDSLPRGTRTRCQKRAPAYRPVLRQGRHEQRLSRFVRRATVDTTSSGRRRRRLSGPGCPGSSAPSATRTRPWATASLTACRATAAGMRRRLPSSARTISSRTGWPPRQAAGTADPTRSAGARGDTTGNPRRTAPAARSGHGSDPLPGSDGGGGSAAADAASGPARFWAMMTPTGPPGTLGIARPWATAARTGSLVARWRKTS